MTENFNLKYPKVVLFDWDNTLVDSMPIVLEAVAKTFSILNLDISKAQDTEVNMHRSAKDVFSIYFPNNTEEADNIFRAEYSARQSEIKPFEGVKVLLDTLKEREIKIAIVSNKRSAFLKEEVEKLGWADYFSAILGSGDSEKDKPSAIPAHNALNLLKYDGKREYVWFIGDSYADMQCAKESGCIPVLFDAPCEVAIKYYDHCVPQMRFKNYKTLLNYFASGRACNGDS